VRPIHLVELDKPRPAVIITREEVVAFRDLVTVVAITGTVRGLSTEVLVGVENGLDKASVVNCDDVHTVRASRIGKFLGYLLEEQEEDLGEAIIAAFDLHV
jgi:mRNA interferase MazF